jgi:hypothetical protein
MLSASLKAEATEEERAGGGRGSRRGEEEREEEEEEEEEEEDMAAAAAGVTLEIEERRASKFATGPAKQAETLAHCGSESLAQGWQWKSQEVTAATS